MKVEEIIKKANAGEDLTVEEIIIYEANVKPKQQVYGKYGTLAKQYIEEHDFAKYLCLAGDLPDYLHGIDKAAEELYISQPAVSQAIKQLETQLGGKLFNRTHKGMELSETGGKQIFSTVEKALKLFNEAESKYSELKDTATGIVRICASDTFCTHVLIPYIKEYHAKYPNVNLILQNCTSSETIEMLKSGKGDIGFVNLPIDDSDINLSNTVMQLHDTFVASERFCELMGETVDLRRLQDYPLLMLELSTATRQAIVSFAHSHGIHLHPEISGTYH